ncbi:MULTISPECIES: SCO family protein [unclassified Castellaniella]|jgi:protein SCO1/2|uniref:SCO family protein n=1 Tax=unclassified Castellaniella TaxID=2617606 RepID=UPI00331542EE
MSVSFLPARRTVLAGLLASVPLALLGCSSEAKPLPFEGSDITGTHLGRDLDMTDTHGQHKTLADFSGKVLMVFFGYTQCPDVCPTAMAQAAQALQLLGKDASKVQVIMISVDPARDTPPVLQAYVQVFDPNFIGLTGTPEQLEKTARSFKAFYAKEAGPTPEQYAMNHSSAFYLMDIQGEARALLGPSLTPEDMAHDIKLLL